MEQPIPNGEKPANIENPPTNIPIASPKQSTHIVQETVPNFNRIFCFGNAECDQFYIDEEHFESKRPVEIKFFSEERRLKILKISCGTQHTLLLSELGGVFSWGNADDGCLGRVIQGRSTTPGLVGLPIAVDLLSAGESHSVCANSKTGGLFIWGTIKSSLKGKLFSFNLPEQKNYYFFAKKGIQDLKSGANHIVIMSGKKAYSWGDSDTGALGTVFRGKLEEQKIFEPNALDLKSVARIFTTANNTFLEASKGRIYGCGLNNYEQLGAKPQEGNYIVKTPIEVAGLDGREIADITGGEHHTLVLLKSGEIYGAGRNDDGQLGIMAEAECKGLFRRLEHVSRIERIVSASHFNYAKEKNADAYYAWGFGESFVLANGREDALEEARMISNEKFFTEGFPSFVSLGHSFVAFATNPLGDSKILEEKIREAKGRKTLKSRKKSDTKKIKRD